jgi:lactate dehydrogenase-like 2-hydroxyacid dehydrogenase
LPFPAVAAKNPANLVRGFQLMLRVALLDDYAKVALHSADWSVLQGKAQVTVFDRHLSEDQAAALLAPFDVLCTIRERMSLPRSLFERLPNLKLVTIIGMSLPNLDMRAATEHGVIVSHWNLADPLYRGLLNATPELSWGLMISTVRHTDLESRRMAGHGWDDSGRPHSRTSGARAYRQTNGRIWARF